MSRIKRRNPSALFSTAYIVEGDFASKQEKEHSQGLASGGTLKSDVVTDCESQLCYLYRELQ